MCGKRTKELPGKLVLFKTIKRKEGYTSQITERSWILCQRCLNKISALDLPGDKIKEDIELKLDKIRVDNNFPKLLQ